MLRLVLQKLGINDELSEHHCEWEGIDCDEEQQCVEALDLKGRNLTGVLPAELGSLTSLTTLWLRNNPKLTGSLQALKPLTLLYRLDMENTQVTGRLEDLQSLTHMKFLNLRELKVTGQLEAMKTLNEIEWLDVSSTDVTGGLEALKDLKEASRLILRGTRISGQLLYHVRQCFDFIAG